MASKNQKRIKMGYALYVNTADNAAGWTRAGFLFDNALQAVQYRDKHYPELKKWSIEAVRVNCQPVGLKQGD